MVVFHAITDPGIRPRVPAHRAPIAGYQIQLVSLLLFLGLAVRPALGLVVMLPPPSFSTAETRITVVGRVGADSVMIRLGEGHCRTVAVRDGVFHARLELPLGLRDMVIGIPDPGAAEHGAWADSVVLQVLCGPRVPARFRRMFPAYAFHGSDLQEDCLGCHPDVRKSAEEGDRECDSCHHDVQEAFHSHAPDREILCTQCHPIGGDLTIATTGQYEDINPCFRCHKDKIGQFAADYIHGPVAGGSCVVCHDPHGSVFARTLKSPVPVLCFYCHTSVQGQEARVQHKPFAEGRCTECHDPHASGNRWVLVKKSQDLCVTCHGKDGKRDKHNHPFAGKPKGPVTTKLKLNERGELECLSCHSPHATDTAYLLKTRGENACLGCHPGYK